MSDHQWFPNWFWWPFYVVGFPILAGRWVWRKLRRSAGA
jgi:hypothetical protein